jgi:hypothetical protein
MGSLGIWSLQKAAFDIATKSPNGVLHASRFCISQDGTPPSVIEAERESLERRM